MKLQLRLAPRVFANKGSTSITKSNVFVYEEVEERQQKLQFFRFWLTALAGYIKIHRNLITHFDFGQKLLESALFASICSMARNQNESKKRPGNLK